MRISWLGQSTAIRSPPADALQGRLTRALVLGAWAPFQDAGEGGAVSAERDAFSDSACTTVAPGGDATDYEPMLGRRFARNGTPTASSRRPAARFTSGLTNRFGDGLYHQLHRGRNHALLPWWFTSGSNAAFVEARNNMSAATNAPIHVLSCRRRGVRHVERHRCRPTETPHSPIGALGTCAGGSGSAQLSLSTGPPAGWRRTSPRSTR